MHAGGEGVEGLPLAGAADGAVGQGAAGGVDDVDLVGALAVERDGEQAPAGGVGLDVEGQHRRRHRHLGRAQLGVVEHAGDAFAGGRGAGDLAAAADAAVDQVAHGEANVRLERPDSVLLQAVPEGRRVRRHRDVHPHDGFAVEGAPGGVELPRRAQVPGAGGVPAADVEVRDLAVVPHEERAAPLQHAVQVDDRRAVLDAVRGLEDESACRPGAAPGRNVGDLHRLECRSGRPSPAGRPAARPVRHSAAQTCGGRIGRIPGKSRPLRPVGETRVARSAICIVSNAGPAGLRRGADVWR